MIDPVPRVFEGKETEQTREPSHRRNVFRNRLVSVSGSEVRLDGLGAEEDDLAELADEVAAVGGVVDLHGVDERLRRRLKAWAVS